MRDFTMYFLGAILALSMGVLAIIRFLWMRANTLDDEDFNDPNIPLHHHETHTANSEDLEDHKKVA
jgi:hypothetical protein